MNAYFGNAYVRCFVFFSWCENMTYNNTCNTDKISNLWSVISWVCNVETDFKLR